MSGGGPGRAASDVIERHRSAGRTFTAGGVRSFVLERGNGPAVVCLHGVPTSSFLYRKMVPGLGAAGLRGLAFDFPGTGLAERPENFDYSWSGLAAWTAQAIDSLGIDRCHIVVHDIGGPIGLEWAVTHPGRVLSITALDTVVDVAAFAPPWPMKPFAPSHVGEAWLAVMRRHTWRWLFRREGVADRAAVTSAEIDAYLTLLKGDDRGRAFLKIMRGFELTTQKEQFLRDGLAARPPYPTQVIWGARDRMLSDVRRAAVVDVLGAGAPVLLPARHFLQEDQVPALVTAVAALVREATTPWRSCISVSPP